MKFPRWMGYLLGRLALALMVVVLAGLALEIVIRLMPQAFFPDTEARSDRSPASVFPEDSRAHPWAADAADPLRVAVIGDSFTLGAGVQADDAYGARLERLLNLNAGVRPAAVRVFARCGTSTFQQFGLLREALAWRPHLVILGICLNDTENHANPEELTAWRLAMTPREPGPVLRQLTRRSRALAWVHRQKEFIRCRREFAAYYRRLYDPGYEGWGRSSYALELFRNDCANEGAVFAVMIFPLLSENCEKGRYRFEFAHEVLGRRLGSLGIPTLDLLEVFRGKQPVRLQAIPGVDPHPSEIAHRLAAETLFAWLLHRQLIPSEYSPRRIASHEHAVWRRIREQMLLAPAPADSP